MRCARAAAGACAQRTSRGWGTSPCSCKGGGRAVCGRNLHVAMSQHACMPPSPKHTRLAPNDPLPAPAHPPLPHPPPQRTCSCPALASPAFNPNPDSTCSCPASATPAFGPNPNARSTCSQTPETPALVRHLHLHPNLYLRCTCSCPASATPAFNPNPNAKGTCSIPTKHLLLSRICISSPVMYMRASVLRSSLGSLSLRGTKRIWGGGGCGSWTHIK